VGVGDLTGETEKDGFDKSQSPSAKLENIQNVLVIRHVSNQACYVSDMRHKLKFKVQCVAGKFNTILGSSTCKSAP
jgi:hypothetical protein